MLGKLLPECVFTKAKAAVQRGCEKIKYNDLKTGNYSHSLL